VRIGRDDIRPFLQTGFPWHRHDDGHEHLADADSWWAELEPVFRTALLGAGAAPALAQRAAQLVRHRFTAADKWAVFPETLPSLRATMRAGWRNAVLSNHVPELAQLVTELQIGRYVDAVFSSAVVGWEKPNPRFFRDAIWAMDRPARSWMVGDNLVADVGGAENVGIPAILVHPEQPRSGTAVGLLEAVAKIVIDGSTRLPCL